MTSILLVRESSQREREREKAAETCPTKAGVLESRRAEDMSKFFSILGKSRSCGMGKVESDSRGFSM